MTMHSVAKILLVEDHEVSREMLTRRLQRRGYTVCCAIDGPSAVSAAQGELPDIILMDVALGEMDGWEATSQIKANPATAHIPIIALTAHSLESDRQKSIEVGCSDFDTKPVDIERLLSKIKNVERPPPRVSSQRIADDQRIAARQRVLKPGTIVFGGGGVRCVVRNFSETGANFEVVSSCGIPRSFSLAFDGDRFRRECSIVWSTPTRLGVKFA